MWRFTRLVGASARGGRWAGSVTASVAPRTTAALTRGMQTAAVTSATSSQGIMLLHRRPTKSHTPSIITTLACLAVAAVATGGPVLVRAESAAAEKAEDLYANGVHGICCCCCRQCVAMPKLRSPQMEKPGCIVRDSLPHMLKSFWSDNSQGSQHGNHTLSRVPEGLCFSRAPECVCARQVSHARHIVLTR